MKKQLILASSSPRRKALLAFITEDFIVLSPDVDEDIDEQDPAKLVMQLAERKAQATVRGYKKEAVVIGSDTVVVLENRVLGKPKDKMDASRMLSMLSGQTHEVYTGFSIIDSVMKKKETDCVCTKVSFNEMTIEEIDDYIKTGEPMDKAGAYGIQGYGSKFIAKIQGDYFCVMGFPVSTIYKVLKDFNCL